MRHLDDKKRLICHNEPVFHHLLLNKLNIDILHATN